MIVRLWSIIRIGYMHFCFLDDVNGDGVRIPWLPAVPRGKPNYTTSLYIAATMLFAHLMMQLYMITIVL